MADGFNFGLMNLFGGDAAGLNELLTPEQQAAMQRQGALSMAAQLLAASGPSRTPVNLGQALGQAYMAGQQGYSQAQQQALTGMLTKQKIDEYKRKQNIQSLISKRLAGVEAGQTPAAAPTPVSQPPIPGIQPTEAAATAAAAAGGAKDIAARYRQIGMDLAALDPQKASTYFTLADKISPMAKPMGAPITVQSPSDPTKNILLQPQSDGSLVPLPYAPPGMSKAERARYNLDLARFQQGQYTVRETGQGFAFVPNVPGLPTIPIYAQGAPAAGAPGAAPAGAAPQQLKGAGSKPTEGQAAAVGFTQRMENTSQIMADLEAKNIYPGYASRMAEGIPIVGETIQRWVQSPEEQQYYQAARDWIRAKLRKESGAAIGEKEMEQEYSTYFPLPGDTPQVIQQKREARRVATEAMRQSAGEFYKPYTPADTKKPKYRYNPVTGKLEKVGG